MSPTPFKIEVPQATINRIMERVRQFEWPDAPEGGGWAYGAELSTMKEIVEHWLHGYDWYREQEIINRLPHFKARVRDLPARDDITAPMEERMVVELYSK